MKAAMSTHWLPSYGQRNLNERGGPRTPEEISAAALREASRILSETEAAFVTPIHTYTAHATRKDAPKAHAALAESLFAVLPVLDELAQDAHETALAPLGWSDTTIVEDCAIVRALRGAFDRNRATDAALEAQAGR